MSYSSEVLADSPLIWLRLGELSGTSAADSSGNGRNGTHNNTPTLGVAGALAGDSDAAATFNGTNEDVSVANGSWMNTGTAMSAECWVKSTATSGVVFSRGGGTSNPFHISASGAAAFLFRWGSASANASVSGTTSVNDGQWHHVVGTFDGTTLRMYVDGVLEGSSNAASTRSLWVTSADLRVASRGTSTFMAGTIDECALYGTALSQARITAHYDAGISSDATGTFAATLPTTTASFSGTYREAGSFSAVLPALTGSFTGTYVAPPTGTFAATLPSVAADIAGDYTPPATPTGDFAATLPVVIGSFAGDYHPHEAGTFDAVLPSPAADFTGTYTPGLETGSFAASLPIVTADFAGTYITLGETGTFAATLPLVTAAFVGIYDGPVPTDTSNALDGLDLVCVGYVTLTRPDVTPPTGLGVKVDKAIAYPNPVMVDGRVT